jgi:UDP-glucose:glycoprotein glucosyltransferase
MLFVGRINLATPKAQFDFVKGISNGLIGPHTANVLEYALSINYYAPHVEMLANIYQDSVSQIPSRSGEHFLRGDCDDQSVVEIDGKFYCEIDFTSRGGFDEFPWENIVNKSLPYVFDSFVPTTLTPTNPPGVVILHGDFKQSFNLLFNRLKHYATQGRINLVIRPKCIHTAQPIALQGFGVELAIKNMEYKVIDDTKIDVSALESAPKRHDSGGGLARFYREGDGSNLDIEGLLFPTLLQRRPDLSDKLSALRKALISESEAKHVAAWDMRDLGRQAVQAIIDSHDPLGILAEIAGNFPMHATAMLKRRVSPQLKTELSKLAEKTGGGTNYFELNGQSLEPETADVFQLFHVLLQEGLARDRLGTLGLSPAQCAHLQALPAPSAAGGRVVDTQLGSEDTVTFFNNIELDSAYSRWPRELNALLARSMSQIKHVRRNLYTGVLVIDPARAKHLQFLASALYLANNQVPLRLGLAFSLPDPKQGSQVQTEYLNISGVRCTDRGYAFVYGLLIV